MGMLLTSTIALGVAMDAFAVSISNGMRATNERLAHGLRMSTAFGVAQCLMTLLGFQLGDALWLRSAGYIGKWIAVVILFALGSKMIWDGKAKTQNPNSTLVLNNGFFATLLESIAVSIDAFMIGLGLSTLTDHIVGAALYIGLVTLILSACGFALGHVVGSKLYLKPEFLGGGLLIGISIYIALGLISSFV